MELWRPFVPGRPRLVSIEHAANDEIINIITPISKVCHVYTEELSREVDITQIKSSYWRYYTEACYERRTPLPMLSARATMPKEHRSSSKMTLCSIRPARQSNL